MSKTHNLFFIVSIMSEKVSSNDGYLQFAVGVFKIDHMAAGFPDLRKVAEEWSKDSNFKELIVRGVSETNYGIQFIYVSHDPEMTIKRYREELKEKYGSDFYAWDLHTSISDGDQGDEKAKKSKENMKKMIIKSEAITLD